MNLHPELLAITDRIRQRSASTRAEYLQRIDQALRHHDATRAQLGCTNLAHGYAAARDFVELIAKLLPDLRDQGEYHRRGGGEGSGLAVIPVHGLHGRIAAAGICHFPAETQLGRLLRRPVVAVNDADAAGMAEMREAIWPASSWRSASLTSSSASQT